MGADPSATIWYGVKRGWDSETGTDKYLPRVIIDLFKTDPDYEPDEGELEVEEAGWANKFATFEFNGLKFEQFWTSTEDDPHGFGVKLFHTDWDYSPHLLDLDINTEVAKISDRMNSALLEWGITDKPQLYISCKYW